jgi:hypothetical protein
MAADLLHIPDAVFVYVCTTSPSFAYLHTATARHSFALRDLVTLHRDVVPAVNVARAAVVASLRDMARFYVCDARTLSPLLSYTPLCVFSLTLRRVGSDEPRRDLLQSLAGALLPPQWNAPPDEWAFCDRPVFVYFLGQAAAQRQSLAAAITSLSSNALLPGHYVGLTEANASTRHDFVCDGLFVYRTLLGSTVDGVVELDLADLEAAHMLLLAEQAFMLSRFFEPEVALALASFSLLPDVNPTRTALAKGVLAALVTRPWALFFEELIDFAGLCTALEDSPDVQLHAAVERPNQARNRGGWVALRDCYKALSVATRVSGANAAAARDAQGAHLLRCLGMVHLHDAERAHYVMDLQLKANSWLVGFVAALQSSGSGSAAAASPPPPTITSALARSDIIFLQTPVPVSRNVCAGLSEELDMFEQYALWVARPLDAVPSLADIRSYIDRKVAAAASAAAPSYFPLIVVQDLQLWTPRELWFWLAFFLSCRIRPSGHSMAAPFKLLLLYTAQKYRDDCGAAALLLPCARRQYMLSMCHTANGAEDEARPRSAKAMLVRWLRRTAGLSEARQFDRLVESVTTPSGSAHDIVRVCTRSHYNTNMAATTLLISGSRTAPPALLQYRHMRSRQSGERIGEGLVALDATECKNMARFATVLMFAERVLIVVTEDDDVG